MTDTSYWREKADEYLRLATECDIYYPELAVQYRALAAAMAAAIESVKPSADD
jgi:hypothetical protein